MASSVASSLQAASSLVSKSSTAQLPGHQTSSAYFGTRLPNNAVRSTRRQSRARQVVSAELRAVDASELPQLIADGYKVVDVRDERQYEKSHIKDSEHIPLFIENKAMDPRTLVLRLLHNNYVGILYGNAFTKPNPEFQAKIKQIPQDQKMLLVCQEGLRSGQAADDLEDRGWENVAFIAKGLNEVKPGVVEKEGRAELQDAGKGGVSQYQQPVSIVVGSILITLIVILQVFPDQAGPYVRQIFENASPAP